MIEMKNKDTGEIVHTVDADTLQDARLRRECTSDNQYTQSKTSNSIVAWWRNEPLVWKILTILTVIACVLAIAYFLPGLTQPYASLLAVSGAIAAALIAKGVQDKQREMLVAQFNAKMDADRKVQNEQRQLQEKQFREKQEVDQIRFDRQALDTQFTDILNRLSNKDSVLIRANAAIRLAHIASQPIPGKQQKLTPENYSFFERASAQLAAALHMEQEQSVRDEVIRALRNMTTFGKQDNQELLHILISDVAGANRSAKKYFLYSLAEFKCLKGHETDYLDKLSHFAPLCDNQTATMFCLEDMAELPECRNAVTVHKALRDSQGDEASKAQDYSLYAKMQSAVAKLMDSRDALVHMLTALSLHNDVPDDLDEMGVWRRSYPLVLNWCFLAGADLAGILMPGAELNATQLHGVCFTDADLRATKLSNAQARKSRSLYGAKLIGAQLDHSDLQEADIYNADLTGANFQYAQLRNARMISCNLEQSDLLSANLRNTGFRGSNFRNAKLYLAEVFAPNEDVEWGSDNTIRHRWGNTNWREANFDDMPPGDLLDRDEALWENFNRIFPGQPDTRSSL